MESNVIQAVSVSDKAIIFECPVCIRRNCKKILSHAIDSCGDKSNRKVSFESKCGTHVVEVSDNTKRINSKGGRPKKYKTEEERKAAIKETASRAQKNYYEKNREKMINRAQLQFDIVRDIARPVSAC